METHKTDSQNRLTKQTHKTDSQNSRISYPMPIDRASQAPSGLVETTTTRAVSIRSDSKISTAPADQHGLKFVTKHEQVR